MEKILIGEKQYIGKQNQDNFLNIDLNRTIETIKNSSFNNIFNFQEQFNSERNGSLKFCIYGIIESRYSNCEEIALNIQVGDLNNIKNLNPDVLWLPNKSKIAISGYSATILSYPLSSNNDLSKNIYGTAKSSYFLLFEIDKSSLLKFNNKLNTKFIYLNIFDPIKQIFGKFSIPFLYFDDKNDLIDFGTETAIIDDNNEIAEINNNFPFFYDRHWIKFNIQPDGPQTAFFVNQEATVNESINNVDIEVSLEEASKYGLEKATIVIDYATKANGEKLTSAQIYNDFNFVEPILSWNIGQQISSFNVSIIDDLIVESTIEQITFKIVPISNVNISENKSYSFTLKIESEDQPVGANFEILNQTLYKPYLNNLTSYTTNIIFDSPIPLEQQTIEVKVNDSETTAQIGLDYYINQTQPYAKEIIINVPKNAISVPFTVYLRGGFKYDVDKIVTFNLVQTSSNISIGNFINKLQYTIKDGITYKYVRYVIPVDLQRKYGVFKTILNTTQVPTPNHYIKTILRLGTPNLSLNYPTAQMEVTNLFYCALKITNNGATIIWNNKVVKVDESFNIPLDFNQINNDFNIDLPGNTNFDPITNSYQGARYSMEFSGVTNFYPTNVQNNSSIQHIIDTINNCSVKIDHDGLPGSPVSNTLTGDIGTKKMYLITELNNVFSTYNSNINGCSTDATITNSTIYCNGGVLVPHKNDWNSSFSTNKLFFYKRKVAYDCNIPGLTLPVGTSIIPEPPYNEKYAILNLGKLYIQAGYEVQSETSPMKIGAFISGNAITDPWRFFFTWDGSNNDTKINAELVITNLGSRDVKILGKDLLIHESIILKNNNINFNNINLTLQSNDNYDSLTNSFKKLNYHIKIQNILLYDTNNLPTGIIAESDLGIFQANGGNFSTAVTHRLNASYSNAHVVTSCNSDIFLSSTTIMNKNIKINGVLLFAHTGTQLTNVEYKFVSGGYIFAECANSTIPYEFI